MAYFLGWTVFLYTLALSITLAVFAYTAVRGTGPGTRIFTFIILCEAAWILGNICELLSPSFETKLFWDHFQYIPNLAVPFGVLVFSLVYSNKSPRPFLPWLVGLGAVLVGLAIMVITNGFQSWSRPGAYLMRIDEVPILTYSYNRYDWLVIGYSYAVTMVAFGLLVRLAIHQPGPLRIQTLLILAGYGLPVLGNLFSLFNTVAINPQRYYAPYFLAIGNLLVGIGLFRFRLFNVLPAARAMAVEHIQDILVVLDPEDRVLDLNPAAQQFLGITAAEAAGKPVKAILPPQIALQKYALECEDHDEIILPALTENDSQGKRFYELNHLPILNQQGRATARLLVLHDITVRKRNEEYQRQVQEERILLHSEAKFRMTIQQFNEGFVMIDRSGEVMEWNRAQEKITGIPRQLALGRLFWDIMEQVTLAERRSEEHTAYYRQVVIQTLRTGRFAGLQPNVELQIQGLDGQRKYVQQTTFPVQVGDEYLIAAIFRDVTAQKEARLGLERFAARMKILHEIDHAILAAEHPTGVVSAALEGLHQFGPFHGSGVVLVERLPGGEQWLGRADEPPCFQQVPEPWLKYFQAHPDHKTLIESPKAEGPNYPQCARCMGAIRGEHIADQRLAVTLVAHGRLMGVLHLCLDQPAVFSTELVEIVQEVGDQLAIALQQEALLDQTQRRVHELTALYDIARLLNYRSGLADPLDELTGRVARLVGAQRCMLILRDEQGVNQAHRPAYGLSDEELDTIIWVAVENPGQGLLWDQGYIIAMREEDLPPPLQRFFPLLRIENLLAVPMDAEEKRLGVLVALDKPGGFQGEDIHLLTVIASQAAHLVTNTRLFRQLTESYDATIIGWSKALELREKETQNHSERVTTMALELARRMGMDEQELPDFERGVRLHDIGKMGIPDEILLKPGPLDEAQWEIMRQHPIMAFNLLKNIPFLQRALVVPYYHHERWDGSGYPHGLRGEDIPFTARLFAVVDAWDALTNNRPYRESWNGRRTAQYLKEKAGILFDPQVVEEFLKMVGHARPDS